MAIFVDAQTDAADLASLVNENGLFTTRYGDNPKKSWLYMQGEFDTLLTGFTNDGNDAIDDLNVFIDAAKVDIANDVAEVDNARVSAIANINSDLNAFDAYYQSAKESLDDDVATFTIDSDAALADFAQNSADAFNEFDLTLDQYKESRGFNNKGTFAAGFTYELPNDVGIDASGNPWIYNGTLPFTVTAGTTPTSPTYTQVSYGIASQVSMNTSDTVQSFADSFALKIFQSPTDGGLTEIQTRTVDANEVYEVRKTSDNSLATIYSDAAGVNEITQNGVDNTSNSDGVVELYVSDGDYYMTAGGKDASLKVERADYRYSLLSSLIAKKVSPAEFGRIYSVDFYHDGAAATSQGYGSGEWKVVDSSTVSVNGIDIVQSSENANVAYQLIDGDNIKASSYGVYWGDSADALQRCLDKGQGENKSVTLPSGLITIEKPVTGIKRVTLKGSGRDDTTIQSNGDYTVLEHTTNFRVFDLSLENIAANNVGIGFGNRRDDLIDNQSLNCVFERVSVKGFDFSWWLRASVWCSWRDCYSRSLVGIRFARNADPYDVTSDAPANWNFFDPLGWFHNAGVVEQCNFEDAEVGVYGCPASYTFTSVTTQGQKQDKTLNKIIQTTEEPTGIWLQSGKAGTRNGWSNTVTSHYTEACRRPFYFQDQRSVIVEGGFMQGGSLENKYPTPIDCDNSLVYLEGVTGQDYFDARIVVRNGGKAIGKVEGVVTGGVTSVEAGSVLIEHREFEDFIKTYTISTGSEVASFEIPVDLQNNSHYRLLVGGLYNGSSIRHGVYEIFRYAGDALTSIIVSAGDDPNFNVSVNNGVIVIDKTGSSSMELTVTLEILTGSCSTSQELSAI